MIRNELSASSIVKSLADVTAKRITRQIITALQRGHEVLSGDDSGLANVWDEVCVQIQHEESIYWDAYDEAVRSFIEGTLSELPAHEREALWLQTEAGRDWEVDEGGHYPVDYREIVDYLATNYVYRAAARWSNRRIRAFLELSAMRG